MIILLMVVMAPPSLTAIRKNVKKLNEESTCQNLLIPCFFAKKRRVLKTDMKVFS